MATNDERPDGDDDGVDSRLARHGHVSYLEIPAVDVQQSAAFYEGVFGWRTEPRDAKHVSFDDLSGDLIGRWVAGRASSGKPGLLPYIYVDRIDEIVERIGALGGEVMTPPYTEGNLLVATFRDPGGNLMGIWQVEPRQ